MDKYERKYYARNLFAIACLIIGMLIIGFAILVGILIFTDKKPPTSSEYTVFALISGIGIAFILLFKKLRLKRVEIVYDSEEDKNKAEERAQMVIQHTQEIKELNRDKRAQAFEDKVQKKIAKQKKIDLEKEKKMQLQKEQEQYLFKATTFFIKDAKHIAGLPISENQNVDINYSWEKIQIRTTAVNYDIAAEKIIDMNYKTESEIKNIAYSSSAGGALGGAMMFGPVGALVLGRTKKHEQIQNTAYLFMTYLKEKEPQHIAFEVASTEPNTKLLVQHFSKRITKKTTIEL